MDKIKNKWPLALIAISLLGYTHYMVSDKIAIGLIVLFYIVEVAAIVVIIIGMLWLFRWWLTDWQISQAKINEAKAKAKNAGVLVITAGKDEQIAVRDDDSNSYYRQLHLSASSHVNGQYQQPSVEQLAIYNQWHQQGKGSPDSPIIIDMPEDREDVLAKYDSRWIGDVVLTAYHLHITGPTGSGKTTLANAYLDYRLKQNPQTKILLINPKDIPGRKPFIIRPNCDHMNNVMDWLLHFHTLLDRRKSGLDDMATPLIYVIDEWDWIYDTYGNQAINLLRPLIKVGRDLNISVLLIGQSPQSGDTGLNGSLLDNMVRVGLLASGEKLLNSLVLDKGRISGLRTEFAALRNFNAGLKTDMPNFTRYCLVTALGGNPSIEIVPPLATVEARALPEVAPATKTITPPKPQPKRPTPEEMRIFVVWRDLGKGNRSFNKLWKAESGNASNVSRKKADEYRDLFDKYGVKY